MDAASFKAAVQALRAIPQMLRDEVCDLADKLTDGKREDALAKLESWNAKLRKNREEALSHAEEALMGIKAVKKGLTKRIRDREEKGGQEADAAAAEKLLDTE